jgi:uncharacterized protein YifE (UPF0438 family)
MKFLFVAALSLTASTAHAAQLLGTFTVPSGTTMSADPSATFTGSETSRLAKQTASPAQAINTGVAAAQQSQTPTPTGSSPMSSSTMTPTAAPQAPEPTGDRNPSTMTWGPNEGPYQAMPYSWYQQQGKMQLECGYGWKKDSSGTCQKESWYQYEGCYETIIINKKPHCPVAWVTKTMEEVVTVTMSEKMDTTVFVTHTMTDVMTATNVKQVLVTQTSEVPTTRIWVSTEVMNETLTKLKTMTETKMATQTAVYTQTETQRETQVNRVTETDVVTRTVSKEVVVPTTSVSVWVTTQVNDKTETQVVTKSTTLVNQVTQTQLNTQTETQTQKVAITQTITQPTTSVRVWTTTDVQNETETRVRTLSSTVVQSVTATTVVSEVVTATTTNLRQVKETALMDCLNTCKGQWNPMMPAPPQPSYQKEVKPTEVYAPAPTYTPPMMKDNMPSYAAPKETKAACGSYGC